MKLKVCDTVDSVVAAVADYWIQCQAQAVQQGRQFSVSLSGGSTPKALYSLLAGDEYGARLDWRNTQFFWGDERFVPHNHTDSNFLMVQQTLLRETQGRGIQASQIHGVPYVEQQAHQCAEQYQREIVGVVAAHAAGVPSFDLVLLGMGEDGHTASLFPGTGILQESEKLVAAVWVEKLKTWRISMTYPLLNNARHIAVLVTGAAKGEKLNEVLVARDAANPITGIHGSGEMVWFVDRQAAAQLPESIAGVERQ